MATVSDTTKVITVGPEATIARAAELKDVLLQGLAEAEHLHVDVQGTTEIDLSFLQMLCGLHRQAVAAGKAVTCRGIDSASVVEAAGAAGFIRHIGCLPENTCIWSGGNE